MRVRKAIIPAAGWGTRFLPATKAVPKEMLPIVDKPAIQYIVEEAVNSGIEDIIIVTGRNKRGIEDHFDRCHDLEYFLKEKGKQDLLRIVREISEMADVHYVRQKEQKGLGHAVLCARKFIGKEPFAVILPDDIIDAEKPCLAQMIEIYEQKGGAVIAVEKVPREEVSRYGVVKPEEVEKGLYRILDLVEKPPVEEAPSDLAVIGRYILPPEIFKHLEKTRPGAGGEIQLTDALRSLLKEQTLYAYEFAGTRYDTGDKLGFLEATVAFGLKHPQLGRPFRSYLQQIVGQNSLAAEEEVAVAHER